MSNPSRSVPIASTRVKLFVKYGGNRSILAIGILVSANFKMAAMDHLESSVFTRCNAPNLVLIGLSDSKLFNQYCISHAAALDVCGVNGFFFTNLTRAVNGGGGTILTHMIVR